MAHVIIGRKRELEQLNFIFNSNKAELVAIYGRRRIGKTFLVKGFSKKTSITMPQAFSKGANEKNWMHFAICSGRNNLPSLPLTHGWTLSQLYATI